MDQEVYTLQTNQEKMKQKLKSKNHTEV